MANTNLAGRLTRLEDAAPGRTVVVHTTHAHDTDWRALSAAEGQQRLAEAQQQAGRTGTVIEVQYVENWRDEQ